MREEVDSRDQSRRQQLEEAEEEKQEPHHDAYQAYDEIRAPQPCHQEEALVGGDDSEGKVVVVTRDSVVDFKRQITALLLKVKLTRQTITSTVSELKRLHVGDVCKSLKTLADNIFEDLRTILESQRRHVLSSMLQRGVKEIGSAEMKVFLDTDLVPYLTAKERRVTTRARVKEVGDDQVRTLQAYERLRQICDGASRCSLKLSEIVNVWLLPLL